MQDPVPIPSNIYPSLYYDDAPAAIEWLCRVFGFKKRLVVPDSSGGVRHSDTVLVTASGCELLTKFPLNLESLVIRRFKPLARLRGEVVRRACAVSRKESLSVSPGAPP